MRRMAAIGMLLLECALSPAQAAEHRRAQTQLIGSSFFEVPSQVDCSGRLEINASVASLFEKARTGDLVRFNTAREGEVLSVPPFTGDIAAKITRSTNLP